MAVGDAYKLDLFQTYAGQKVMNSLAFDRKAETAVTQAECQALAQDFKEFLRPHQMAQLTHTGWRMQQLSGAGVSYTTPPCKRTGGLLFDGVYTGTVVGTLTGDGMPPQSAAVFTMKTGLSGRSRRGRFYMTGLSEGIQTDGTFGGSLVGTWTTAWATMLAKYTGAGTDLVWRIGVWSQTIATGCKPNAVHPHDLQAVGTPSPATAFTPVITVVPRPIVYSQRRRTIGVGS